MRYRKSFVILVFVCLFTGAPVLADTPQDAASSPKPAWGDFQVVTEETSKPWYAQVLLWPVNRVLDIIDVVRLDVGVGVSGGGVLRVSKHAQMGYRVMRPGSLRLGVFGRKSPLQVESSDESGFITDYKASKDRVICKAELGVGVDLLIPAAYAGICFDEFFDLLGGVVFLDPSDDDIR